MSASVINYQKYLKDCGLYSGSIDGDFGPQTLKASYALQIKTGITIPRWMIWAAGELGQKEVYGNKENPRIIHYHSFTSLSAKSDEIAWCASFVNAALKEGANIDGTHSASAASFRDYGRAVQSKDFGAILLKKTNTGSMRHVFFNAGFHEGTIFGLGGNQSNAVTVAVYSSSEITESRSPILS